MNYPAAHSGAERLQPNFVKPSDDDGGYVIQWVHSPIPSNMMASHSIVITAGLWAGRPRISRRGDPGGLEPAMMRLCWPLAK